MVDTEVFDTGEPEVEIIEKKKKGRAPMSAERKEQLKEQLQKAREKKKALKAERMAKGEPEPPKDPKAGKNMKILDQVGETPEPLPAVYVTAVKKNQSKEINFLKLQIEELKKAGTTKEDIAMIKELKAEMKELRDIAKEYKKKQNEMKAKEKLAKEKAVAPEPVPEPEPVAEPVPVPVAQPRYSTYKKSIWSKFT